MTLDAAKQFIDNYNGELTVVGKTILDLHTGEVWAVE